MAALRRELGARRAAFAGRRLASLYLGGGTPSLLRPESVAELVRAVREAFPGEAPDETTLEVNPSTLERERLAGFRAAGVTRLSVGVQSFDDTVLRRLGRAHRAERGAPHARGLSRRGLRSDLARPDLRRAGSDARRLRARSGRGARLRAGARLDLRAHDRGRDAVCDRRRARKAGAARRGARARHAGDGRGAAARRGPARATSSRTTRGRASRRCTTGATGSAGRCWASESAPARTIRPTRTAAFGVRRANRRELAGYLRCVEQDRSPEAEPAERLDAATARGEAMFLGLRAAGVDAARFAGEFGAPPQGFFRAQIEALSDAGLLDEAANGDLRLTPRGWQLADHVATLLRLIAPGRVSLTRRLGGVKHVFVGFSEVSMAFSRRAAARDQARADGASALGAAGRRAGVPRRRGADRLRHASPSSCR